MKTTQTEKKKNAKTALRANPPRNMGKEAETETSTNNTKDVVSSLRLVLSDTFVLYMKTYAVHWNYQGPKFFSVHKMTEEQYQELAEAIDTIAERIRALDRTAPISLEKILASSDLEEMSRVDANSDQALINLVSSHSLLARRAHEAAKSCEMSDDVFSQDMMIQRVGAHDKAAWMLRSFLDSSQSSNASAASNKANLS